MSADIDVRELVQIAEAEGQRVIGSWSEEVSPNGQVQPDSGLTLRPVADIVARARQSGPRVFLVKALIPEAAYGVIGAQGKGAKTFDALDLACSVNTGTPWFGLFESPTPGPVAAYFGEGDERSFERRLTAIMEARGGTTGDLDGLHMAFRVPRLGSVDHLAIVQRDLARIKPVLCIVDPLYLAAGGARSASLFDMGTLLAPLQEICQAQGTALANVWHWNQTGQGRGALRFTGAGAVEWGRFLGSAEVERKATEPGGVSLIQSRWEWSGSDVPDVTFRVRRRIWAEDPDDLDSPLHYEVEASVEQDENDGLSIAQRRTLAALGDVNPPGATVREIGDALAKDGLGPPLQKRTINKALTQLSAAELVDGESGVGTAGRWWAVR